MKSAFELDWMGGAAEALLRRRRPGIDDLPWGSLDPAAYPATLVERARASWTEGAYNEYCSGAAFAELAAALLAARAPIDLVAMAGDFVVDEMLHVELNSRMAMELGGGALSLVDYQALVPRPAASLDPLARASELVVRLCCVGESFTLPILIGCMRAAAHPLTRAVLSRLARDEVAHARFGWIYLDWLGDRLDRAERARLAAVAGEGLADYAAELAPAEGRAEDGVTPEGFLVRHIHELGWMEASEYARLARRAVRDRVIARLARHRIEVADPTLS